VHKNNGGRIKGKGVVEEEEKEKWGKGKYDR